MKDPCRPKNPRYLETIVRKGRHNWRLWRSGHIVGTSHNQGYSRRRDMVKTLLDTVLPWLDGDTGFAISDNRPQTYRIGGKDRLAFCLD